MWLRLTEYQRGTPILVNMAQVSHCIPKEWGARLVQAGFPPDENWVTYVDVVEPFDLIHDKVAAK